MSAVSSAAAFETVAARPAPVVTVACWVGCGATCSPVLEARSPRSPSSPHCSYYVPGIIDWAVINAVTRPDDAACRALDGAGACWGVIAEKYRLILFGRYPFDEQWRPLVATVLMVALLVASCTRPFWSRWLLVAWMVVLAAFFVLMRGGVLGLSAVETDRWGGLPLTLLLSTIGIAAPFRSPFWWRSGGARICPRSARSASSTSS